MLQLCNSRKTTICTPIYNTIDSQIHQLYKFRVWFHNTTCLCEQRRSTIPSRCGRCCTSVLTVGSSCAQPHSGNLWLTRRFLQRRAFTLPHHTSLHKTPQMWGGGSANSSAAVWLTSKPRRSFSFQKQKCVTFLSQNSSGFTTHTSDTSAGMTF